MGGGKSMPMPQQSQAPAVQEAPTPPEADKLSTEQVDAMEKQRKAAAAAKTQSPTVLTGVTGDSSEPTTKTTVLGSGG